MKTSTKILLLILSLNLLITFCETKTKGKKAKKHHQSDSSKPEMKNQHISEIMIGNPNTMVKDRTPLWKDFKDNRLERPFMHGVVGPQWQVPVAENNQGFDLISSPMPRPQASSRIIANEYQNTYSPTAFDMPQRKDVIQTQIPNSVTRTIEAHTDPRFPPKRPVEKLNASFVHGTHSTNENVVINFAEKNASRKNSKNLKHKNSKKGKKHDVSCLKKHTEAAMNSARSAYRQSSAVLDSISSNLVEGNHSNMILDVHNLNKKEHSHFSLNEKNHAKERRMEELRKTPAGVRAAHTPRRID